MRHLVCDNENIVDESFASSTHDVDSNREILIETSYDPKIVVDIASLIDDVERKGEKKICLELFPSKRDDKFYERYFLEVNRSFSPLFYSLTWHDVHPSDENYFPLEVLKSFPNNTILHLTACKLTRSEVVKILDNVLLQGKTTLFLLRGDDCKVSGDFVHAIDLVRFVRDRYGSKFGVCVAGYPQMHPESTSKQMDLMHLRDKVNAGANFIITQIFFESKVFIDFVKDCRSHGINVPILAGVFPIQNYKNLCKMAKVCKIEIPDWLMRDLQPIRNNDEAVRDYGIALARTLITDISASGAARIFHLFTLNSYSTAMDVSRKLFD